MKKKQTFARVMAITGSILVWVPLLAPFAASMMTLTKSGMLRFDYLMPAEMFPSAVAGGGLLLWTTLCTHLHRKMIGWSLGATIGLLVGGQTLAAITGLASGATEPTGWAWAIVLISIGLYSMAVLIMGIGGLWLIHDLFKPRIPSDGSMENKSAEKSKLIRKVFLIFPLGAIGMGLMFFLPAGTLEYWPGWLLMATLLIPAAFVVGYFLKHDPKLLERRMQYKEKEMEQKLIIKVAGLFFVIGMIVPGLDYRYGWSNVPAWLVIAANVLVFSGYLLIFFVFKENSYASRIIVVEKGQKVISTGPYAVVRHPMYVGVALMYAAMPIALGSYWAMIFYLPIIPALIFRILNEEKVLSRDLEGYKEYCKKVKYRMIPGIW